MIENYSIAIRLLNIQNDKIANAMLAPYGLSHAQFKVLNLLYARPAFSLRQVDIEDFFQISNPTVTGILRSLEDNLAPVACIKDGSVHCEQASACMTIPMWKELDDITNAYLDGVTLEDLLTGEKWKAGH